MKSSVIVLNWNGWADTIECLESLFHLDSTDFRVIVCDNASGDGSIEKIQKWATGEIPAGCANSALRRLTDPPSRKPIPYRVLSHGDVESRIAEGYDERLVLIENGANLGFAAGNNVGLRYALGDPACRYFWILNNDTVVEPDALSAILRCFEQRPGLGLCGSVSRSYSVPEEVQVWGGRSLDRWTGRTYKSDGPGEAIDYVEGCSMAASRLFLEQVGLLHESYFLYFEELDWAMRARGKLVLGYCRESVIYHKEGASIGSHADRKQRSLLSEQYLSRSRVLFMRRFFPWALPVALFSLYLAAAYHFLRRDFARAKTILVWSGKGLLAGNRNPHP